VQPASQAEDGIDYTNDNANYSRVNCFVLSYNRGVCRYHQAFSGLMAPDGQRIVHNYFDRSIVIIPVVPANPGPGLHKKSILKPGGRR
jgi:hypothetical protein